jgi:hypothetical protein
MRGERVVLCRGPESGVVVHRLWWQVVSIHRAVSQRLSACASTGIEKIRDPI